MKLSGDIDFMSSDMRKRHDPLKCESGKNTEKDLTSKISTKLTRGTFLAFAGTICLFLLLNTYSAVRKYLTGPPSSIKIGENPVQSLSASTILRVAKNDHNNFTEDGAHRLLFDWSEATAIPIRNHNIRKMVFLFYSCSREDLPYRYRDEFLKYKFISPAEDMSIQIKLEKRLIEELASQNSHLDLLFIGVYRNDMANFQYFIGNGFENMKVPFLLIIEATVGWRKYLLNSLKQHADVSSQQAVAAYVETYHQYQRLSEEFIKKFLNNQLSPWLRSEVPIYGSVTDVTDNQTIKTNRSMLYPGEVQAIVGTQFSKNVMETHTDTLLLFTAAWCGVCRKFEKSFKELALAHKKVLSIDFLSIDITRNDIPFFKLSIDRVPSVFFFRSGAKDKYPLKFDHAQKNIVAYGTKFLQEYATCSYSLTEGNLDCTLGETNIGEL